MFTNTMTHCIMGLMAPKFPFSKGALTVLGMELCAGFLFVLNDGWDSVE